LGLSIGISGGIILTVLVMVLMTMPSLADRVFSIVEVSSEVSKYNDSILRTDISLSSLETATGSALVNFTLNNEGGKRIWNFEKTTVIITYEAVLGELTEILAYSGDCAGGVPSAGNWCIESISNDFLNPEILDNGEGANVRIQSNQSVNGGVAVVVATDNGIVSSISKS